MLNNSVFCPNCHEKYEINSEQRFELGKQIECKECEQKFNIFKVYKEIYKQIPLGRQIADEAVHILYSDFNIAGGIPEERTKIERFMEKEFKPIFKEILYDCVVFGTCVLRTYHDESNSLKLERLDLENFEFNVGFETKGGQAYYETVQGITNTKTNLKIEEKDLVILYTQSSHHGNDLGFSLYGMWFTTWELVKIGPMATQNARLTGRKELAEQFERSDNYYINSLIDTLAPLKITNGTHERDHLESSISGKLFSLILQRPTPKAFDDRMNEFPRIKFIKSD